MNIYTTNFLRLEGYCILSCASLLNPPLQQIKSNGMKENLDAFEKDAITKK
jgi:hypothetical protein